MMLIDVRFVFRYYISYVIQSYVRYVFVHSHRFIQGFPSSIKGWGKISPSERIRNFTG